MASVTRSQGTRARMGIAILAVGNADEAEPARGFNSVDQLEVGFHLQVRRATSSGRCPMMVAAPESCRRTVAGTDRQ